MIALRLSDPIVENWLRMGLLTAEQLATMFADPDNLRTLEDIIAGGDETIAELEAAENNLEAAQREAVNEDIKHEEALDALQEQYDEALEVIAALKGYT